MKVKVSFGWGLGFYMGYNYHENELVILFILQR